MYNIQVAIDLKLKNEPFWHLSNKTFLAVEPFKTSEITYWT